MSIPKKIGKTIAAGGLVLILGGCEDTRNKAKSKGGYFGTTSADYIIRNDSGGVIMDVWKLRDAYVSSPDNSDGWIFSDEHGNSINVSGDVKTIRINDKNSQLWDQYHEYHAEFESKSYRDLYNREE